MKPFRLLDRYFGLRRRFARRDGQPAGVLLVAAGGLGDTVLFSAVLPRFLALARPGETVSVLLRKDGAKTAFLFPDHVQRRVVDFARLRRDAGYRREVMDGMFAANFRLVVSTDHLRHPDLDEALIRACAAPETAAMEPRSWPKHDAALRRNRTLYTRLVDSGPLHRDKVLRWCAFAAALTGVHLPPPQISIPANRLPDALAGPRPAVLVQAFSAVKAKQSPPALFEALFDALGEACDIRLLGAPGELDANPAYKPLLARTNVTWDQSGFEDLVPALRGAALVVSADTAMMHLAVAVGAPTLCLASAAYVGEIVPYAEETTPPNARFLYEPMACQGCLGDCRLALIEGMYPCLARLDAARVIEAARAVMAHG